MTKFRGIVALAKLLQNGPSLQIRQQLLRVDLERLVPKNVHKHKQEISLKHRPAQRGIFMEEVGNGVFK